MNIIASVNDLKSQDLIKIASKDCGHDCDFFNNANEISTTLHVNHRLLFIEVSAAPQETYNCLKDIRKDHSELLIVLIAPQTIESKDIELFSSLDIAGYLHIPPMLTDLKGIIAKI